MRTVVRWRWWLLALVVAAAAAVVVVQGANRPEDPELAPAAGAASGREPLEGFGEIAFAVTSPDGAGEAVAAWCALLADEPETRQQGLQEQEDLLGYDAMVFRFEGLSEAAFTMRNTPSPLTVAFFAEDGAYLGAQDMEPCPADAADCPSYPPPDTYLHALEVPQGGLDRLGITDGATLSFPDGGCGSA